MHIRKYMCIIYVLLYSCFKRRYTDARFDLFLYLSMNCMLGTVGTEFSQLQPTGCVASILLSNISGNTPWFLINILSNTTSTFQNNAYSYIFTLGHEPPFMCEFFIQATLLFSTQSGKKEKIEIAN